MNEQTIKNKTNLKNRSFYIIWDKKFLIHTNILLVFVFFLNFFSRKNLSGWWENTLAFEKMF